MSDIGQIAPVA